MRRPASIPAYVVVRLLGGLVALGLILMLRTELSAEEASEMLVPPLSDHP